ncbi:MAG: YceI family protein [Thermodesulfobacteriota bacterium]
MAQWVIDEDHSAARFSIRHFMIANVVGLFSKLRGLILFDPPDPTRLSVEGEVEVRSLTTGHAERDEHLLSPDYFNAPEYPKILFKSTKVESVRENHFQLSGELTMVGITKPITLEGDYFGPVKSPFSGKTCVGFSATGKINREDYGMKWNEVMEGGGVVMGREVKIEIDIEADLVQ